MQTEVGDSKESMAMLMVELILTMGTQRLRSLLKDLINGPDDAPLLQLLQSTSLVLSKQESSILEQMALATTANSNKHTAWLWGTILPSISSRAAADAADKGHLSIPKYSSTAEINATLKFDHKLAHNAFLVYLNVQGGQNDWAVFEARVANPSQTKGHTIDYQTGIYAGDVLTLQVKLHTFGNFKSPLPEFVQRQAFVLMKYLRRKSPASQADIKSLQLALKIPEDLQLEHWKPGNSEEAITQYDATVKKISKLTKLPTPNAWAN
jgi:hypothetical protein